MLYVTSPNEPFYASLCAQDTQRSAAAEIAALKQQNAELRTVAKRHDLEKAYLTHQLELTRKDKDSRLTEMQKKRDELKKQASCCFQINFVFLCSRLLLCSTVRGRPSIRCPTS